MTPHEGSLGGSPRGVLPEGLLWCLPGGLPWGRWGRAVGAPWCGRVVPAHPPLGGSRPCFHCTNPWGAIGGVRRVVWREGLFGGSVGAPHTMGSVARAGARCAAVRPFQVSVCGVRAVVVGWGGAACVWAGAFVFGLGVLWHWELTQPRVGDSSGQGASRAVVCNGKQPSDTGEEHDV